jgi:hypothetical protein
MYTICVHKSANQCGKYCTEVLGLIPNAFCESFPVSNTVVLITTLILL